MGGGHGTLCFSQSSATHAFKTKGLACVQIMTVVHAIDTQTAIV